jgi:hypothetical protein
MMFGLFGPEIVQFAEIREDYLTFVARTPKRVGTSLKVRFQLNDSQSPKVDVLVRIVATRPSPANRGHLCVGIIQMPDNERAAVDFLLQRYATRADLGAGARRSQRFIASLKTLARELPNFSCLTLDLSLHGARLHCLTPVHPGQPLSLIIESDMDCVHDIAMRGRAVWCRKNPQGRGYLVGVEFEPQSPAKQAALKRFHDALGRRQRSVAQHAS